ncbi:MAG: serine/threonine protein kinase [Gammaproteobacteria bacterium]|nr:serine/threonine protein kinase [Gammaproteobacteria bacterium]MBU1447127.1 serine/threonine protein kinase [Gammaproteobacteria bacterium]MDD2928554.1 serine/threonine-protein kinase [Sideroxydans sp.]MDD5470340.1 serine/threonine-protein kinase [Sideroxydans sp.]
MISQLGRYEVISELGQGAMGVVYKARDPLIDREVAIKTINLSLALEEREEYEARFYQEAKAAGRLSHPNIVTIYDVGRTGDIAYIAMEYLHGRELRDVLNENKTLPVSQVLDIIIQVAQGLAYAHEHEIVHRDVKPSNVMIVRDGHVKITDFGIARMASAAVRTQTGMVLGSPKYMSPEQVLGKLTDQRSDIFSLGVMLYEMLTGHVPFIGENVNAIMYQTLNAIPAPPSNANPSVPEMLNYIVAKALAKDLEARYQNAGEMVNDLRACRETLPRDTGVAQPAKRTATITRSTDGDDSKTVVALGLSSSFDSTEATMRLAVMTASKEEVEELSKTLRMERPGMAEINRAAPRTAAPHVVRSRAEPPGKGGGYMLLVIVVLIVVGLLSALIF